MRNSDNAVLETTETATTLFAEQRQHCMMNSDNAVGGTATML